VELAGAAFMNMEDHPDFPQTELARVAHADHGAITRRQPGNLFTQNRGALILRQQIMGRQRRRAGNGAFEIGAIFSRGTLHGYLGASAVGVPTDGVQHFSSNPELRISRERRTAFGRKRPPRLQETKIAGLNQIGQFDSGVTGERGENARRDNPYETIEIPFRFDCKGLPALKMRWTIGGPGRNQ